MKVPGLIFLAIQGSIAMLTFLVQQDLDGALPVAVIIIFGAFLAFVKAINEYVKPDFDVDAAPMDEESDPLDILIWGG